MKAIKRIIVAVLAVVLICSATDAHPGRTDANGGHYNRKTGEYHYHNSGRSRRSSYDDYQESYTPQQKKEEIKPNGFYFVKPLRVSGDSGIIKVRFNSAHTEDIRLIGGQPKNAKNFADYIVENLSDKKVWIEFDENLRDGSGVFIAYFWLTKPNEISAEIVEKNLLNAILASEGLVENREETFQNRYAEYIK